MTGSVTATTNTLSPIVNNSTGLISVVGNISAGVVPAITSTNASSTVKVSGDFIYSATGVVPVYAQKFILDTTPSVAKTRYALNGTGTYVDMFTADNSLTQAAPADVRNGTVYADGNLTGTCAVPAAASVAFGVPVDATTGTAALTPAAVWEYATREITGGVVDTATTLTNSPDVPTESEIATAVWGAATKEITGGTVDTLTNAPSVPSAASIRAEIDSNSTQLAAIKAKTDLLPASPAATGDIPTADITAIKGKTDLLETTRLAQCSTVATTGAQLAAALS